MGRFFIACFIFLWAPFAAWADDLTEAQKALELGNYNQAHDIAKELDTAEGYALASEALALQVFLGETEELKKTSKKARKLAEKALALNPDHQNARLQYAVTDGFVARLTGDVSAWMKKLPQKSFANIEAYRTAYPDDPRGDALLGAWHFGVVRKTGNENARKWFGASIEQGQTLYEKALLANPNDPVVIVNYAAALLALKEGDFSDREKPRALLSMISELPLQDNLSVKTVTKGQKILSVMDQTDLAVRYAEAFLDGEAF